MTTMMMINIPGGLMYAVCKGKPFLLADRSSARNQLPSIEAPINTAMAFRIKSKVFIWTSFGHFVKE